MNTQDQTLSMFDAQLKWLRSEFDRLQALLERTKNRRARDRHWLAVLEISDRTEQLKREFERVVQ